MAMGRERLKAAIIIIGYEKIFSGSKVVKRNGS
jgi:hypothetical protein